MKYALIILLTAVAMLQCVPQEALAENMAVAKGAKVSFDYTLTVDGKVVDSSEGKKPFEYIHGEKGLMPALSQQMENMKVGEEKVIVLRPEDAYGYPNPEGIKEIPFTAVPKDIKPEVGMVLQMQDEAGRTFPARVTEVKKDSIIIDLNPPLAGKTLTFKIKIVSIK